VIEQENIKPETSILPMQYNRESLVWEVATLKEKIKGMDKAIEVAHNDATRVPTEIQKQVGSAREFLETLIAKEHALKEEKFTKVYQRFDLIEQQRLEQKKDTADNVDKAFLAAKEAVREQNISSKEAIIKSENSFNAQLKSLEDNSNERFKSLESKITDLKDRVTKTEGITAGISSNKTEARSSSNYMWGVAAIIASIIFGLIGVYMGTMLSK
jgi:hypothetical protein